MSEKAYDKIDLNQKRNFDTVEISVEDLRIAMIVQIRYAAHRDNGLAIRTAKSFIKDNIEKIKGHEAWYHVIETLIDEINRLKSWEYSDWDSFRELRDYLRRI